MNNTGSTLITAPIRPQSSLDTYPVAFADEILGGHHQVINESARLNISPDRLKDGMLVSVNSTSKTYQYSGGTWTDLNFEFLRNLEISSVTNDQVITFDSNSSKWIVKTLIGSLYETGTTTINNTGTTNMVIGRKDEDRGITLDYTLYRSGATQKYQIGRLYVIHDNIIIKVTDENTTTGNFKIVDFSVNFDGFNNNLINLESTVESDVYDVIMNYHLKKIKN